MDTRILSQILLLRESDLRFMTHLIFLISSQKSRVWQTILSPHSSLYPCIRIQKSRDHLPGSPALVFRLRSHHHPSPPSFYSHRTLCCCLLPKDQCAIIPNPSQSGNQNTTQRELHALDELERHGFGDPETTPSSSSLERWSDRLKVTGHSGSIYQTRSQVSTFWSSMVHTPGVCSEGPFSLPFLGAGRAWEPGEGSGGRAGWTVPPHGPWH